MQRFVYKCILSASDNEVAVTMDFLREYQQSHEDESVRGLVSDCLRE